MILDQNFAKKSPETSHTSKMHYLEDLFADFSQKGLHKIAVSYKIPEGNNLFADFSQKGLHEKAVSYKIPKGNNLFADFSQKGLHEIAVSYKIP